MDLTKVVAQKRKFKKTDLERYFDRESRSEVKHQFFNGKVKKMHGSSYNHNKIAAQLTSALVVEIESK
ncbi:MAG: hypothetical protein WAU01_13615, partial [Saprospiraceae bacterium]